MAQGNKELVEVLLRFGADVRIKDCTGQRAIDKALMHGHQYVARRLQQVEAEVRRQTCYR